MAGPKKDKTREKIFSIEMSTYISKLSYTCCPAISVTVILI